MTDLPNGNVIPFPGQHGSMQWRALSIRNAAGVASHALSSTGRFADLMVATNRQLAADAAELSDNLGRLVRDLEALQRYCQILQEDD